MAPLCCAGPKAEEDVAFEFCFPVKGCVVLVLRYVLGIRVYISLKLLMGFPCFMTFQFRESD